MRHEATSLLQQILPITVRFMSDEYDDTCSTVFTLLQTVLSAVRVVFPLSVLWANLFIPQYKRSRKLSSGPIEMEKRNFLASLLQVILEKMKWDADAEPADINDDDNEEFEKLRKVHLNLLCISIANPK